ncbi:MAG: hypothetical protein LBS48_06195 [Treponema sp.]|nr:hypothetical protein [Treponema sp.]
MGRKPWIPGGDAEFDEFLGKYCHIVSAKTSGESPAWTHIPQGRVTELLAAGAEWHAAYVKLLEPHTPADTLAKNQARKAAQKTLEDFNNQYILYAREVTNPERAEIGAHVRDTVRTPEPKPTCQPQADVVYPGPHLLKLVNIRRVPGIGDDPPEADYGVRIFWGVTGDATARDKFRIAAAPEIGDDLPHSTFTHRRSIRFDFEGDSGKTVWFCLRYENSKGGKDGEGPFGPFFSAIIP